MHTATKMKAKIIEEIELPEGIQAAMDGFFFSVKGPKGELKKKFVGEGISISADGKKIIVLSENASKVQKKMINTFAAHMRNMVKGVQEPFVYKLKVCAGHFPMNVSVSGDVFTIKNFLGEKVPRTLKIRQGANVKVDGKDVYVESIDKEIAAQAAAEIEKLTIVKGRDRRIFQDGIYIVSKAGKEIK